MQERFFYNPYFDGFRIVDVETTFTGGGWYKFNYNVTVEIPTAPPTTAPNYREDFRHNFHVGCHDVGRDWGGVSNHFDGWVHFRDREIYETYLLKFEGLSYESLEDELLQTIKSVFKISERKTVIEEVTEDIVSGDFPLFWVCLGLAVLLSLGVAFFYLWKR